MESQLKGKVCLVTGATAGLGQVTARVLAERGATVVVGGRNREKSAAVVNQIKAQTGNPNVEFLLADLSSQQDVSNLARDFQSRYQRLDVLVNNAGALFIKRQTTVDGLEMTFALNHLNYFLLTNLLLDTLKAGAPARIVNVASDAHEGAALDFDDLQFERRYGAFPAYARSKLANIYFTYELARRLDGSGVTANALHPGFLRSRFLTNNGWFYRLTRPLLNLIAISSEEGARTVIYLATSPQVAGVSGKYFVKERQVRSSNVSYDEAAAHRLWQASAELTGWLDSV